jgi:hypothetical protein
MELKEASKELRSMADRLASLETQIAMPVQQVDIPGAFAKLRSVFGTETHLSITADFDSHRHYSWVKVEWKIYRGTIPGTSSGATFVGPTLSDAVNAVLESTKEPKVSDPSEEIDQVTKSLAEPLPL